MPRDLRYDVLPHRAGLRDRLRAIGADPRLVLGATIAVLLVVVPAAIAVGLVLAGTFGDNGGALAVLTMLFLGGLWTLGSLLREGAKGSALTRFARVNRLDFVEASAMPGYAGSLFADDSRIVSQSVRTRERPFVEVGDTFLITAPKARYNPTLGRVQAGAPNQPELFLRGQLSRHVARQQIALDPALQERLSDFAGDHVVEVAADEVTVAGSKRLDADGAGRVEEAFALIDAVVAQVEAHAATWPATPSTTLEGGDRAGSAVGVVAPRRAWRPMKVIGAALVTLVVVPLGFAFVMSILDNTTRSRGVAILAVNLFIAGSGAAMALVLRRASGSGDAKPRPRWRSWLFGIVGAVAFVALGAVAIDLDQPEAVSDDDLASAADCGADDPWCQEDVSARVWAEGNGLTRVGEFDWQGCYLETAVERSACPVRVACPDGYADLWTALRGQPLEVVGASAKRDQRPLARTTEEVQALVAQRCGAA